MADLPAPTAYLDHRAFLRDWFDAKKSQNKRFSHRAFVRRTGQKSPSLLADVIAGRRNLTADGLEGFITALGLSGNEAEWFSDLVAMHQAESTEERAEGFGEDQGEGERTRDVASSAPRRVCCCCLAITCPSSLRSSSTSE